MELRAKEGTESDGAERAGGRYPGLDVSRGVLFPLPPPKARTCECSPSPRRYGETPYVYYLTECKEDTVIMTPFYR